jgi:protein-S-isoprenylcysteine O-methyltransferase Ste14
MPEFFNLPSLATPLILAGAGWFLFVYHVRTRRFDPGDRPQVSSWRTYFWIDLHLKLSTLAITIASLHWDHPMLLELPLPMQVRLAGLVVCGVALGLFSAAMWALDHQFTPAHQARLPTAIVQTGPYRFIRHPVYTSNLVLLSGLTLVSGSLWVLLNLGILVAYYLPTIPREEAAIERNLPQYTEYASRTGMLFPRLRRPTL